MVCLVGCSGGGSGDSNSPAPIVSNSPPNANAGSDKSANENSIIQLSGSGSDSDGTISGYSWEQTSGPSVNLADATSASTVFTGPEVDTDTELTFRLTVTDDDGATGADSVTITLLNVNEPPVADAGFSLLAEENEEVLLVGSGSDNDGSIIEYEWSQVSGMPVSLSAPNLQTASFISPFVSENQTLVFELKVTDDDGSSSTDEVTVEINEFHDHNVMLRVVRVTEDWMPYASTDGWTAAVPMKESLSLKYYEVAIWEETNSVHLYAFGNDYDPLFGLAPGVSNQQKIDYREANLVMKFDGMPDYSDSSARSEFLKTSFVAFAEYLVQNYPHSDHHLMYNGHGGPGGRLFAGQLQLGDVREFLQQWTDDLGRRLGVIDMGGPCNKGSLGDMQSFCRFADYYIASDLPNGGYAFDDWTIEKYEETNPERQYHPLLQGGDNLREVLSDRVGLKRAAYEYAQANMTSNRVEQANYLYSCASYADFEEHLVEFLDGRSGFSLGNDLLAYLEEQDAPQTLLDDFEKLFISTADNRDFFDWDVVSNGLLMIEPSRLTSE